MFCSQDGIFLSNLKKGAGKVVLNIVEKYFLITRLYISRRNSCWGLKVK
jgi:hypothetical protein